MTEDLFQTTYKYAEWTKAEHAKRITKQDKYLAEYLMDWKEEKAVRDEMEGIRIIKSPDVRNRIQGGSRLLSATMPAFSCPPGMNTGIDEKILSHLETTSDRMFRAASRVASNPIQYDVSLSLNMFGEVHSSITRTADLLSQANARDKNQLAEAAIFRAEEIARITPYMYEIMDPRGGYPELDNMGLRGYYREVETTVGDIVNEFISGIERFPLPHDPYEKVTLCQLWNWKYRYVWVEGDDHYMYTEPHGLPFIPITVELGEGSLLFEKPEDQRQPMGFTIERSGLGNIQNLSLTLSYAALFKIGTNPQWVAEQGDDGDYPEPDHSLMGGVWRVPNGGSLTQVDLRNSVNPMILDMLKLADDKVQQSTIYSQTLGEPLGGNATYSESALMHQAGRLPLLLPQQKGGRAIADMVKKSLIWMRIEKPEGNYDYKHILGELEIPDIPDHFELDCKLDVSLPTDNMQNATVATTLVKDRIAPKNWVRENIMKIAQPGDMTTEIWSEESGQLLFDLYVADQSVKLKEMQARATMPIEELAQKMVEELAMQQMAEAEQGAGEQGLAPGPAQQPSGPVQQPEVPLQPGGPVQQPGLPEVMREGGQAGPLPIPGQQPEEGQA